MEYRVPILAVVVFGLSAISVYTMRFDNEVHTRRGMEVDASIERVPAPRAYGESRNSAEGYRDLYVAKDASVDGSPFDESSRTDL